MLLIYVCALKIFKLSCHSMVLQIEKMHFYYFFPLFFLSIFSHLLFFFSPSLFFSLNTHFLSPPLRFMYQHIYWSFMLFKKKNFFAFLFYILDFLCFSTNLIFSYVHSIIEIFILVIMFQGLRTLSCFCIFFYFHRIFYDIIES